MIKQILWVTRLYSSFNDYKIVSVQHVTKMLIDSLLYTTVFYYLFLIDHSSKPPTCHHRWSWRTPCLCSRCCRGSRRRSRNCWRRSPQQGSSSRAPLIRRTDRASSPKRTPARRIVTTVLLTCSFLSSLVQKLWPEQYLTNLLSVFLISTHYIM